MAMTIRAQSWQTSHSFHHGEFPAAQLAAEREAGVSVCLPARDEAATIGPILRALMPLLDAGVVDQVLVVDDSRDGTDEIARALGAEVHAQEALAPELGPVLGKGDAMWRALPVIRGRGGVLPRRRLRAVRRPLRLRAAGTAAVPAGDRVRQGLLPPPVPDRRDGPARRRRPVTELCARALLNLFYPELAAVRQPLAGEIAARRELLERVPFVTGYGVDIGLLLDAYGLVGLEALAQVDLDVRQNAHQPLRDLGPMAHAVLQAVSARLARDGRLSEARCPRAS